MNRWHVFLDFIIQSGFFEGGTEGQVEDGGGDHCDDGVYKGGHGTHLGKCGCDVLGDAQDIKLVKVSYQRIRKDIKDHAGSAGKDRHADDIFGTVFVAEMEELMGNQADNETDQKL